MLVTIWLGPKAIDFEKELFRVRDGGVENAVLDSGPGIEKRRPKTHVDRARE